MIKNSQKFATLVATVFLLFISTPIAPDPIEEVEVSLSAAIKVTPSSLDFSNMHIGVPKSTPLTVTNISDNTVSITPSMEFSGKSAAFLDSKLEFCSSGICSPLSRTTKIKIAKGGHQEFVVTVTLRDDSPKTIEIAGDLKVIGEVLK